MNVGPSLTLVTVRIYVSETLSVPVPSSVAVTTIVWLPTFAWTGVPLIVEPLIVIVLGAPDIE